jgi:hypothetical protein
MILSHDGVQAETAKAVLVTFEDNTVWIPLSLVDDYDEESIEVEDWFAEQEGLECYEQ